MYEIRQLDDTLYSLYMVNNVKGRKKFACGNEEERNENTHDDVNFSAGSRKARSTKKVELQSKNLGNEVDACIRHAIDIDYYTYQDFNEDIDQVVEWCVMNIGGLSSMYQSEINVSCTISYIHVFTYEANPYDNLDWDVYDQANLSSQVFMNAHESAVYTIWGTSPDLFMDQVSRNVVAYISRKWFGGGKAISGISSLCDLIPNPNALNTDFITGPAYIAGDLWGMNADVESDTYDSDLSFNMFLLGHELGHVIGGLHTHGLSAYTLTGGYDGQYPMEMPYDPDPTYDYEWVGYEYPPYNYTRYWIDSLNSFGGVYNIYAMIDGVMMIVNGTPPPYCVTHTFNTSEEYGTLMRYFPQRLEWDNENGYAPIDAQLAFHPIIKEQRILPFIELVTADPDVNPINEGWTPCDLGNCDEEFIVDNAVPTGTCQCPIGYQRVFISDGSPATELECLECAAECIECVGLECLPANEVFEEEVTGGHQGGIWKHNVRCDLYNNYYNIQYPWEIELVETVGQTVEILRSVEYQLESYLYKGNLPHDCGDRFHVLDYNFDEVVIYNTEQVSGLLKLVEAPKNNIPEITTYPKITNEDIEILFSKEEQKYRFDMFWDVTRNRGEFDPNITNTIWKTELNGYIRHLNAENLDYDKAKTERKKFRHYYNKVLFRKGVEKYVANAPLPPTWQVAQGHEVSANIKLHKNKMLLRLANTKLNKSFR